MPNWAAYTHCYSVGAAALCHWPMAPVLILSSNDVDNVVASMSPQHLLDLMATVFSQLSSKDSVEAVDCPHRTKISMPEHTALFMPGRVPAMGTAIKIVSVPSTRSDGLPATNIVLDEETGTVSAMMNATRLTALRTAAGASSWLIYIYSLID